MTPESQATFQQIQELQQQALAHAKFFGFTSYAALILCALFAILIFWKLCQIEKLLRAAPAPFQNVPPGRYPMTPPPTPLSPPPPKSENEDSKYMPKR